MSVQHYRVLSYCKVQDIWTGLSTEESIEFSFSTEEQGVGLVDATERAIAERLRRNSYRIVEVMSLSIQPMLLSSKVIDLIGAYRSEGE